MIIVGDLHFDCPENYNVSLNEKVENIILKGAECGLRSIVDFVEEGEVVIFLGDVFEKKDKILNIAKKSLVDCLQLLTKKKAEMFFVLGNHDRNKEGIASIDFLRSYGRVLKRPKVVDIYDESCGYEKSVLFIPYTKRSEVAKLLDAYRGKGVIVCGHVEINGLEFGNGYKHSGEDFFDVKDFAGYEFVFNGHYHKHQVIKNVICVGSIYETDFGDMGDKVFYVNRGGKWEKRFVGKYFRRKIFLVKDIKDVAKIEREDLSDCVVRYDIGDGSNCYEVIERLRSIGSLLSFYNYIVKPKTNDRERKKVGFLDFERFVDVELQGINSEKRRKIYAEVIRSVL